MSHRSERLCSKFGCSESPGDRWHSPTVTRGRLPCEALYSLESPGSTGLDAESRLAFAANNAEILPEGRLKRLMGELAGIRLAGSPDKDMTKRQKCKVIDTSHLADSYPDPHTAFRYQVVLLKEPELKGIVSALDHVEYIKVA